MKTVLIVDDSEAARVSLSFALKQKGYKVLEAADGDAAVFKIAGARELDLIITDVNMPGMNGLELITKVRGLAQFRFTPIIVLSSEKNIAKQCMDAGASGWVGKSSLMSEQLMQTITRLMPPAPA